MRSFRGAMPFSRGCVADLYLNNRGLKITDGETRSLRFSASLWHWPTRTWWPAMLAQVTSAAGEELTTHQTFLARDGSGKAPLGDKARLFVAGSGWAGGGIWFGVADSDREFIVAEGIESLLSALRILGAAGGCAALSEGGIRRLILPPAARRVRILADHDPHGQGLAAAQAAKRRWTAEGRTVAISISPVAGQDANDVLLQRLGRL
jgi:putative DNA primase/helicase